MKNPNNKEITGSVQKKNNKWYMVINLYDENGKRCPKWICTGLEIRGNKKNAASMLENKLEEYNKINDKSQNFIIKREKMLFCDFIMTWLDIQENKVNEVTFSTDEVIVRVHLYPYFKEKGYLTKDINSDIINCYFKEKANGYGNRKPLSGASLLRHYSNISSILNKACDDGYIEKENLKNIVKPRCDTKMTAWYTLEQTQHLIKLLDNENSKLLLPVLLASYYGLRREEVVGLKESNLNFSNHMIYIQNSVATTVVKTKMEDGKTRLKTAHIKREILKTNSSRRSFPMIPEIESQLKRKIKENKTYMELFGNAYNHENDGYIFVHENGNLITPDYITHTFGKFIKRNNLDKITFHGLRHSCASLLLTSGYSMKEIQEWLGHASYSTTEKIYAHVSKESKNNMATTLSSIMKN